MMMMMVMMMMNGMRKSKEKSDLDFQMSVNLHHCFNDNHHLPLVQDMKVIVKIELARCPGILFPLSAIWR